MHQSFTKGTISKLKVGKGMITVKLKAKPASLGAAKYKIEYRIAGKGKWKSVSATGKSKVIKKLKKGSLYVFRAQTVGKSKSSKWSKQKTLYFSSVKAKVTAGKKKVTVQWKKDKRANGYQIRYSYSSKMSKAKTIKVKKNKTKYTIKRLKKGKKVFHKIVLK